MKNILPVICLISGHFLSAQKFISIFDIPDQKIVYAMASSTSYIFAGTAGSGIFRSHDDGANWTQLQSGGNFFSMFCTNDSLYAGGFGAVIFSADNGTTWTNLNLSLNSGDNVLALAKNGQGIFAGIWKKGIYMRSLSGGSWAPKNTGLHASAIVNDILCVGQQLIIATDQGIYTSLNNGGLWTSQNTGIPSTVQVNKLYKRNNIVIAGTSNGFYKSINEGSSWASTAGNWQPTPNIVSLGFVDNTFFGGVVSWNAHGLMLSKDMGNTWATYTASPIAAMPFYSMTSTKNYVFAGNATAVSRYESLTSGLAKSSINDLSVNVYPNPCNEKLTFTHESNEGPMEVKLYDQHGKLVSSATSVENELSITTADFVPGFYFASVKTNSGIQHIKIVRN